MHILLNAAAATAGGGITYLRNAVPHLAALPGVKLTVLSPPESGELESSSNVRSLKFNARGSSAMRFWREQRELPQIIKDVNADVLISAGNFALRRSPIPQILLSRNSLYTSRDFYDDLLRRRHYSIFLDTKLKGFFARRSVRWADATVAPSRAFAQDLRALTGREIKAIHHGFDRDRFLSGAECQISAELSASQDCFRLLLVSHYNYYRNFEILLRALAIAMKKAPGKKFKLFLTCKLVDSANPGSYRTEEAAALVRSLGIRDEVVELGTVPHKQLPHLYRACNAYVTAAYAESFAHPLVEAMSCGLPVVASNIAVHQEICNGAAIFFERFSPEDLAAKLLELADSRDLADKLSRLGREQSSQYSWTRHAEELVDLAASLLRHSDRRREI